MRHPFRQTARFKQTTRWLLAVFVLSWMNLVFQAPAHAAMKLDRILAEQAGTMSCHCPPPICDTVLSSADDQSITGIQYINPDLLVFNGVPVAVIDDDRVSSKQPNPANSEFYYPINSPPPLLLKTVLLI